MPQDKPALTTASDETLAAFIRGATKRVVVMSPAVSRHLAEAIGEWWREHGPDACTVVLDVDAEVYRLGYGCFEALELLERTAAELGTVLARQPGVRIGLVIADDETWIYAPTPELVEAGAKARDNTNAVRLTGTSEDLVRDLGVGPNGVRDQVVGLDKADRASIEEVDGDLTTNPPQKFDLARVVRVFNAAFEFVEIELKDAAVERRTVTIPKHLLGVQSDDVRERYSARFQVLPSDSGVSGKELTKAKDKVMKMHTRPIPGYGRIILRKQREAFDKQIVQLKRGVKDFQETLASTVAEAAAKSRDQLKSELLPRLRENPPKSWQYRGAAPNSEMVAELLEAELAELFDHTSATRGIQLNVRFKGVTYELLHDANFMEAVREAIPELPHLHEEYDAARQGGSKTDGGQRGNGG